MPTELLYGIGALAGGMVGHLYNQKGMLIWPSRVAKGILNLGIFYEIFLGLGAAIGILTILDGFHLGSSGFEKQAWLGMGFIVGFSGPAIIGTIKTKLDLFWPLSNRGINNKLKEIDDLSKQLATQVAPQEDHTQVAHVLYEKVNELSKVMQAVDKKLQK
jgi:hypothetical protein